MKKNFLKILMDMIPVILGIFIGLFLNEWRESRNETKFLNQVLFSINEELKENKEELEAQVKAHENIIDTIGLYIPDEKVNIADLLGKVNGLQAPTIKNASSKSLLNSNIELVDYKIISALTNIEEGKMAHNILVSKLIDFIYENVESTDDMKKQIFQMSVGDLLHLETQILEDHEEYFLLKK